MLKLDGSHTHHEKILFISETSLLHSPLAVPEQEGWCFTAERISLLCQGDSEFEHYVLVMKIILSLCARYENNIVLIYEWDGLFMIQIAAYSSCKSYIVLLIRHIITSLAE